MCVTAGGTNLPHSHSLHPHTCPHSSWKVGRSQVTRGIGTPPPPGRGGSNSKGPSLRQLRGQGLLTPSSGGLPRAESSALGPCGRRQGRKAAAAGRQAAQKPWLVGWPGPKISSPILRLQIFGACLSATGGSQEPLYANGESGHVRGCISAAATLAQAEEWGERTHAGAPRTDVC